MHKLLFGDEKLQIEVYAQTASRINITFEDCFELVFSHPLPKIFKERDSRIFCPVKLARADNIAERIVCSANVKFCNLKKYLPGIFDTAHIRKANGLVLFEKYKDFIATVAHEVLGEYEARELLEPCAYGPKHQASNAIL